MNRFKKYISSGGRFLLLLFLIIVIFSYAMFQGGFVSWFVLYSVIPFLIYSLLLTFVPLKIVDVHRQIAPSKLQRGDTASVTVSFQNKTWFPLIFVTIHEIGMERHFYEKAMGKASNVFFVGWKRNFQWTYELQHLERGEYHFRGLKFTFTDLFGWTVRHKLVDQNQIVLVYPKISEMKYRPLQMQFEQGGILSPFSVVKDTSMATGIREYQSGDRFSWIHWKSFAKNETLRTKEFEDRQTQEIFLTIDRTSQNNFEVIAELAASIIQTIVKNHGDVSFLSSGEKRFYSSRVKTQNQVEKVMQHLAVVKPDAKLTIDKILTNELQSISSATLLLITGEVTEQLKSFFMNSTKVTRGIVCFVVSEKSDIQKLKENVMHYSNVKVIPITREMFYEAFTEVIKP